MRAAIEAAGSRFFLLPPYSPDMNPIEMAFSKLKTLLRQAPERTRDVSSHGRNATIMIAAPSAITPKSLFGIARKIA